MVDQKIITLCKQKLLMTKVELLSRFHLQFNDLRELNKGGDEADQTLSLQTENQLFASHLRLRNQLLEIEQALMRIERGSFGICEETDEPIENERLMAIPWTRLSIEGAEIREASRTSRRA